jgi:hypothetical protein
MAMPKRLRKEYPTPVDGYLAPVDGEMAKTISRFAMSEHADLTFGTKKSCLDGSRRVQTIRKLGGGRSRLGRRLQVTWVSCRSVRTDFGPRFRAAK